MCPNPGICRSSASRALTAACAPTSAASRARPCTAAAAPPCLGPDSAESPAKAQAASVAEKAAADRRAGFISFAESEIKAGRLLPKDKQTAVAALDKVGEAFSPDGFLNEDAVQTAHRLVTEQLSTPAAVRAAAPAATYTNEFVLKAKQRYAA